MANELADVVNFVRKGNFSETTEERLRSMIQTLRSWRDPESDSLISAIENELARRHKAGLQEGANAVQKSAMEQGRAHHTETIGKLNDLKKSVDQLANARTVDKWILIVGAVAAIAGIVGAILAFLLLKH